MEDYIKLLSHLPMIILGIIVVILANKMNFKKQRKKYEIEINLYNSIIKGTIGQIGYIYIIIGIISFFNSNISLLGGILTAIPSVVMGGKIRSLSKARKRIDKLL